MPGNSPCGDSAGKGINIDLNNGTESLGYDVMFFEEYFWFFFKWKNLVWNKKVFLIVRSPKGKTRSLDLGVGSWN